MSTALENIVFSGGGGTINTPFQASPKRKGEGRFTYRQCNKCKGITEIFDENMSLIVYRDNCRNRMHTITKGCHRKKIIRQPKGWRGSIVSFDEIVGMQIAREARNANLFQ